MFGPLKVYRYLNTPDEEKTAFLFSQVRLDPFYSRVLEALEVFGYEINYSFWSYSGLYNPQAVVSLSRDYMRDFTVLHKKGDIKASITLASRQGADMNLFYFLHELLHFYQDMYGLFFTPLQREAQEEDHLSRNSLLRITYFCESMASAEALRAAWRLKEKGFPAAWKGAMMTQEGRVLGRRYRIDMEDGMKEITAAGRIIQNWHNSRHRRAAYADLAQKDGSYGNLEITLPSLLGQLPEEDGHWSYILRHYTENPVRMEGFAHGSPAYLWRKRTGRARPSA